MKPIVLITGCSSGFGLKMAVECAGACTVIATVRSPEKQHELLNLCMKAASSIDIQYCDVCDPKSVQKLADYMTKTYQRCDVLINNAGRGFGGFFEDVTEDEVRQVFDVNVFGVKRVTKALLPLLRESTRAKIINISSISGRSASPCVSTYASSKWALEGFSESLLFELSPFNIDVVLVEPGQFKTQIFNDNLQLAKNIRNTNSVYYKMNQKILKKLAKMKQTQADPTRVATLISHIITKKRPRFRYVIGTDARVRLLLRSILPFEWYRFMVTQLYKLFLKSS